MITKTSLVAAVFGVAMIGAPAMAEEFRPLNTNVDLDGTLTLSQSTTLDCDVDVSLSIDGNGDATVNSRSFSAGDWQCGIFVAPSGTWTVDPGPGTSKVTMTVGASSILGSCSGTIQADFNNSTGVVTFNNVSIPGTPNACTINGSLSSTPQASIVP
ncbi:hypothetical protein [Maricaulis sp.]|jgi:hypothetical protein|uniref:hypothetical protein n=1 Tax=Maricaulis sp. TaxID=1486257 RepID=UPI001B11FD79|nr:hypothetical protein [Maricaulis sp.]MBO6764312.1 protein activator of alkane oxidation PraB [Maricaulis sp.]